MATYVSSALVLAGSPSEEEISAAAVAAGISTVYSGIPACYAEILAEEDLPASVTDTVETEVVSMTLYDDDGVTPIYSWDEEQTVSSERVVAKNLDLGV